MSKIEKSDLVAGGDAAPVEVTKSDCIDNTDAIITEKNDVILEDTSVENAKEVLNTQTGNERSLEAINDANMPVGELVNPDTATIDDTKIIQTPTKKENVSVTQDKAQDISPSIKAQLNTEESNNSMIALQDKETSKSASEEKADTLKQNAGDNNAACIYRLEAEVQKKIKECNSYQKRLEETERKLAALQASYDAIINQGDENTMQQSMEQLRGQLLQTALMYEERNRVVTNQENQINALNNQVTSLKEVVSITRDLLQIRNMEVKQLQAEVDNMEKKISEERDRHNMMISKMDAAMRLNADLKKEYETQLSLFQSLREKYGEKISLLSKEKEALETAASAPE
ncbi:hypothetical protein PUN28_015156 [Cardiocondyla obscurior]|uniref:Tropomyosin n=1 Tax=Cardiocondyla obscurior TaxID=286306 RepID=A0AAW2F2M2_9HYME